MYKVAMRDGLPLVVLRPAKPRLACAMAKQAVKDNDLDMDLIERVCGPLRVVGVLTTDGRAVDSEGRFLSIEPGDFFSTVQPDPSDAN